TAPAGTALQRRDLAERALDLARMLRLLLPDSPGVAGLLALILLTDARRHARTGPDGRLLVLADQDRRAWDHGEISEGLGLAREALRSRPYTRYPPPLPAEGRHRPPPRPRAPLRSHRLGADPGPVRPARRDLAVPDRGSQPRYRPRRGLRARGRAGRPRRPRRRAAVDLLPLPARRP